LRVAFGVVLELALGSVNEQLASGEIRGKDATIALGIICDKVAKLELAVAGEDTAPLSDHESRVRLATCRAEDAGQAVRFEASGPSSPPALRVSPRLPGLHRNAGPLRDPL
jgi:hypothetical protein